MKVRLNNVRIAFPVLFEAKSVNGEGDPAFSAAFLMPKNHPDLKAVEAAIEAVAKEKWGAKWPQVQKSSSYKGACLADGDGKAEYAGYEGNMFVNARNKTRPLVIDRDRSPLTAQDGKPYAGCFVNVSLDLWAQDNNYGKRVNASLSGVQFYKDGDAFAGGGAASADDFDSIEEGAMADDLA